MAFHLIMRLPVGLGKTALRRNLNVNISLSLIKIDKKRQVFSAEVNVTPEFQQ